MYSPIPRRVRSLAVQLILLFVVPVLILLVLVAYGGIALHEDAMHTLVRDRDQRAVDAIAIALAKGTDLTQFDPLANAILKGND